MMNSKFYKELLNKKEETDRRFAEVKARIEEDLKDNDFIHMAKLITEAQALYEKAIAYDDMIDDFECEFDTEEC